jgi:hypothetical protein
MSTRTHCWIPELCIISACGLLMVCPEGRAQVIDFETLPDGTIPADDQLLPLDWPYTIDGIDVTFGWDTDGDHVADLPAAYEAAGGTYGVGIDGFYRCRDESGGVPGPDTADEGFADELGAFMLRRPQPFSDSWRFLIAYGTPVFAASGQVWDIEKSGPYFERWLVEAYHDSTLVANISSPAPEQLTPGSCGAFDAQPWSFSFVSATAFNRIEISFIGTQPDPGFVFDQFRANTTIPGPTLLTYQPDHVDRNEAGIFQAQLYWSEPVTIATTDVVVAADQATGPLVPCDVTGSGTHITTITFTGQPGGVDLDVPSPLLRGRYAITVLDTARASANNASIDGDADGVAGGNALITVNHTSVADLDEDRDVDLIDFALFQASFTGP